MATTLLDPRTPLEARPPVQVREQVWTAGGSGAAGVLLITTDGLSGTMLVVRDEVDAV